MSELDAHRGVGGHLLHGGHHSGQGSLAIVVPEAEAAGGDSAASLDRGGFGDDQARPGTGQGPQVHVLPGGGDPVDRGIHAHRTDHDAVPEPEIPELERFEEKGRSGSGIGG